MNSVSFDKLRTSGKSQILACFSIKNLFFRIKVKSQQGLAITLFSVMLFFNVSNSFSSQDQIVVDHCEVEEIEEKEFVVIIPSYNNVQWYERNLDSVFSQKYTNYRIIYIDDCSTDETYEQVKNYIEYNNSGVFFTLIKNKDRQGALANLYAAIHSCDDHEIIVLLDGDDWFKDEYALSRVNQAYTDTNIWMTYGQYEEYPTGNSGHCKEIPYGVMHKNVYREYDWVTSHLRTFYAWLFKRVKLEDLLYESQFFQVSWDIAMMLPMLEMAKNHITFIPDILYVYNVETPSNDFKKRLVEQLHCDKVIRARKKYTQIEANVPDPSVTQETAMLIFSSDNPVHCYALLESLDNHLTGCSETYVIYTASTDATIRAYEEVCERFPDVRFIEYQHKSDFKLVALRVVENLSDTYILFAHDGCIVTDAIDCDASTAALEQTGAYAFYYMLGNNIVENVGLERKQKIPLSVNLGQGIRAWQFNNGEHDWRRPQATTMALYRRADLLNVFSTFHYETARELELLWDKESFDLNKVGLYYEDSKAMVLKTDMVDSEFVRMFHNGWKISVDRLVNINNTAVVYNPLFTRR